MDIQKLPPSAPSEDSNADKTNGVEQKHKGEVHSKKSMRHKFANMFQAISEMKIKTKAINKATVYGNVAKRARMSTTKASDATRDVRRPSIPESKKSEIMKIGVEREEIVQIKIPINRHSSLIAPKQFGPKQFEMGRAEQKDLIINLLKNSGKTENDIDSILPTLDCLLGLEKITQLPSIEGLALWEAEFLPLIEKDMPAVIRNGMSMATDQAEKIFARHDKKLTSVPKNTSAMKSFEQSTTAFPITKSQDLIQEDMQLEKLSTENDELIDAWLEELTGDDFPKLNEGAKTLKQKTNPELDDLKELNKEIDKKVQSLHQARPNTLGRPLSEFKGRDLRKSTPTAHAEIKPFDSAKPAVNGGAEKTATVSIDKIDQELNDLIEELKEERKDLVKKNNIN